MELALGLPSPSPPQPGQEQRVLWSQTSWCWAQVWDRAPGRDASSRLEGMHGCGYPPLTLALTLPWGQSHWDGGLSNGVRGWGQERSCQEVLQAGTGSWVLPSLEGPQEVPGAHNLLLSSGAPCAWSHLCRGAQSSPKHWCPAAPCSPCLGWGLTLHQVLGPSRTGCA